MYCDCALSLPAITFWSRKKKYVQRRLQADPDMCLGLLAKVMIPVPALKRWKMLLLPVVIQFLQALIRP